MKKMPARFSARKVKKFVNTAILLGPRATAVQNANDGLYIYYQKRTGDQQQKEPAK
tara:strand:+ start:201 stop:368 length:168 start_codon:yes stop_codon:yes gene_type:complete